MGGFNPVAAAAAQRAQDAGYAAAQQMQRSFGAIAYSSSTGRYGTSWGWSNQADAERTALRGCGAPDATIVAWGRNTYVALAVAAGGVYGASWNASQRHAEKEALRLCQQRAADARIVVSYQTLRGPG